MGDNRSAAGERAPCACPCWHACTCMCMQCDTRQRAVSPARPRSQDPEAEPAGVAITQFERYTQQRAQYGLARTLAPRPAPPRRPPRARPPPGPAAGTQSTGTAERKPRAEFDSSQKNHFYRADDGRRGRLAARSALLRAAIHTSSKVSFVCVHFPGSQLTLTDLPLRVRNQYGREIPGNSNAPEHF